jgi:hypothetical protein
MALAGAEAFREINRQNEEKRLLGLARQRWLSGDLSYLIRGYGQDPPEGKRWAQLEMYRWAKGWKASNPRKNGPLILWCRRRGGKSFMSLVILLERMLTMPNTHHLYLAPFGWQCDQIVRPSLNMHILPDAPIDLVVRWKRNQIYVQNPWWNDPKAWSFMTIAGVDSDDGNRIRGLPTCETVVVDEARDVENFDYLMESIIPPCFLGSKNPLLLVPTTPPASLECPLVKRYNGKALVEGRSYTFDGEEDAALTEEDIEATLETADINKSSNAYLREIRAQLVQDVSCAVVPEWFQLRKICIVDGYERLERPRFFIPHVQIDAARSVDKTAFLFGYADQDRGLIVVEKTIVVTNPNAYEIGRILLEWEEKIWPESERPAPVRRWGDMLPGQIDDLLRDPILKRELKCPNGILIRPVPKDFDRITGLQLLRSNIGRVRVHADGCHDLIYQLDVGTVRFDKAHKRVDFVRTSDLGHLDAVAALRDMVKVLKVRFPQNLPKPDDLRDPNTLYPPGYQPPPISVLGVTRGHGLVTRQQEVYRNGRTA